MSNQRPVKTRIGPHRQHVGGLLGRLLPHRLLFLRIDPETAHLDRRRRLAGAPFDAAVRHQVERGDAFGDPRRMVVFWRHQGDAVAEPDPLGALRAGGEEDLGRRRVRILFEEMVLDLPDIVDAEPVGELDLIERLLIEPQLRILGPGLRQLMLVEKSEFHRGAPLLRPYPHPPRCARHPLPAPRERGTSPQGLVV